MDELFKKLGEYLDAAAGVVSEYAPQAVDAALLIVRIDAIWNLLLGLALLSLAEIVRRFVGNPLWNRIKAIEEGNVGKKYTYDYTDPFPEYLWLCVAVLPIFAGLVTVGLCKFLNLYNWVAAIDPVLGLVYKAAQSAGLL